MQPKSICHAAAWAFLAALASNAQTTEEPYCLWFDADGDQLQDLYLNAPGTEDALLRNAGDGTFEDVTDSSGLAGLRSKQVAIADLDGDGDHDLLRLTESGAVRLHMDVGRCLFEDVTTAFGLNGATADKARFLDYDGDALMDLEFQRTDGTTMLFHNRDGLTFDEIVLTDATPNPIAVGGGGSLAPTAAQRPEGVSLADTPERASPASAGDTTGGTPISSGSRRRPIAPDRSAPDRSTPLPNEALLGSGNPLGPSAQIYTCAASIVDTGGGLCLEGSSDPELGKLYPMTQDLWVHPDGNVAVGLDPSLFPFAKLYVDGTLWTQEPAFFNADRTLASAAVTAYGPNFDERGYLGLDGTYVPFFNGLWNGRDIGVAGISMDTTNIFDNYGILGRSNWIALRAENDTNTQNWAELATQQYGLIASGSVNSALLLNGVEAYSNSYFQGGVAIGGLGKFTTSDQLHLRSTKDVVLRLEADSDNSVETDQPALILSQDGGSVRSSLTYENGTNNLLLDSEYPFSSVLFRQFDENTATNNWEFQNVTDTEAIITDLGNLMLDGSVSSPATDLAEYYPIGEPLEPGDVVAFAGDALHLVRAQAGDASLAGIVSSKPGLLLGITGTDESSDAVPPPPMGDDMRYIGIDKEFQIDRLVLHEIEQNARAPLALSGRVPCKVTAENGPIRPGDRLTFSSIPGYAAKAVEAGTVIGMALQSWDQGTGKIIVLTEQGWFTPDQSSRVKALENELEQLRRSVEGLLEAR